MAVLPTLVFHVDPSTPLIWTTLPGNLDGHIPFLNQPSWLLRSQCSRRQSSFARALHKSSSVWTFGNQYCVISTLLNPFYFMMVPNSFPGSAQSPDPLWLKISQLSLLWYFASYWILSDLFKHEMAPIFLMNSGRPPWNSSDFPLKFWATSSRMKWLRSSSWVLGDLLKHEMAPILLTNSILILLNFFATGGYPHCLHVLCACSSMFMFLYVPLP